MHPRIESIASQTPYWLEASHVPGLTVALIEGGKTLEVHCFGRMSPTSSTPISEDTIFKAASLSKQALLLAALKAVEAGKLDLDRPLASYRDKAYPADDPDIERITARHVLTHCTGWPNWPPDGEIIKRAWPLGQQWTYSGQAFLYLQDTLAAIWGETAELYLHRLVLDPLNMSKSSFLWRSEYERTSVDGFDPFGKIPEMCVWKPTEVDGASTLHTTAREYARLLEAYFDPQMSQKHPDVYRRYTDIDRHLGWSVGWGTSDDILWQWGHHVAFNAFAAIAPSRGDGIVVLSNGSKGQRVNRAWVNAWMQTDLAAFYLYRIEL